MKQVAHKTPSGATVTLYQIDGDRPDSSIAGPSGRDLGVEASVEKYLQQHGKASSAAGKGKTSKESDAQVVDDEDVPLDDDDDDDDFDDDEDGGYDFQGRGTLKASSDAFVEVMQSVKDLKTAESAAAASRTSRKADPAKAKPVKK